MVDKGYIEYARLGSYIIHLIPTDRDVQYLLGGFSPVHLVATRLRSSFYPHPAKILV